MRKKGNIKKRSKNVKVSTKKHFNSDKEDKTENTDNCFKRCNNCFKTHFPYPKLCRWTNAKNEIKTDSTTKETLISLETSELINEWIVDIEKERRLLKNSSKEEQEEHSKIADAFLTKTYGSTDFLDICFQGLKLRGGSRVKIFDTTHDEIDKMLTLFRSLAVFDKFEEHKKCQLSNKNPRHSLCSFCLMRSIIFKSKISQGRQLIKPVEILCNMPLDIIKAPYYEVANTFIGNISECVPKFKDMVATSWICSKCKLPQTLTPEFCINLDQESYSRQIENLIDMKSKEMQKRHSCQSKDSDVRLTFDENTDVCVFHSSLGMDVDLSKPILFGGISWKCVSAISKIKSVFLVSNHWNYCENKQLKIQDNTFFTDVIIAAYQKIETRRKNLSNDSLCYVGDELIRLRNLIGDRHRKTPQRKEDRHTSKEDRHTSKEDRHRDPKYFKKYYQQKLRREILNDTGMDRICCSCVEWKSVGSCKSVDKIPNEKIVKYLIQNDLTKNSDGMFYVCDTCKTSINNNMEPRRAQKEILGFLSFPFELKNVLEVQCTPKSKKERDDPQKKYLELNRLEDYLLKPVIPFIRIGHLPRGSYFQVKGELIMISADMVESLRKILPVEQNLVPVSFKKKLEYTGHYMQEYVDKKKIQIYFDWFKKFNHLFQDYELDKKLINDYEKNALKSMKQTDRIEKPSTLGTEKFFNQNKADLDHLESDEEYEESITLEPEAISSHHSSIITDKYQEDMDAPTVANKIADMIIDLEPKKIQKVEKDLSIQIQMKYSILMMTFLTLMTKMMLIPKMNLLSQKMTMNIHN